jgi:hypothetical protein
MAKAKRTPKGRKPTGVPNLHFFGEKNAPDQTSTVLDRRSIHGDRKIPAELKRMMTTQSVYINSDSMSVIQKSPSKRSAKTVRPAPGGLTCRLVIPEWAMPFWAERPSVRNRKSSAVKRISMRLSMRIVPRGLTVLFLLRS